MSGVGGRRIGNLGAQMGLGPAVTALLLVNVAVFLGDLLFGREVPVVGPGGGLVRIRVSPLQEWGAFIPYLAMDQLQLWRFVTYMFLHGGFTHLLFNMLGLWLFGNRIEELWGSRTFTWYYFVSGIGGAVLYGALILAGINEPSAMVGASGAIYGILLAFGLAFPNAIIFVFFIPMPARIAVVLFLVMALFGFGATNVAHMAHLGGMVTGFIFLWTFTGGHPSRVPRLPRAGGARGGYRTLGARRDPRDAFGAGYDRGRPARGGQPAAGVSALRQLFQRWRTRLRMKVVDGQRRGGPAARRPGNGRNLGGEDPTRVDQILEKISREGLRSLTEEEQEILRRASRKG
ncbi:MAG TPA: rhomboid family intramembrane serine protease [Candidatus Krumholzibacteria bacterium]|nr:rhomboid family intramembrane serine protease [Candidatus Krumholzibacteria bacterium]HPD72691.1 rhomboid family intramembrane serine protease [Candidatus Krumholzibacteria bacterium]HRY40377.1 rhomboid family intramembrane serine protease [Candidatus Krumholzibacteria bacterium]